MKNKQPIYIGLGFLILGLLLGWAASRWLFFGGGNTAQRETVEATEHVHEADGRHSGRVWTCSMHPQIRDDGPEQCPICGMDLIPVVGITRGAGPVTDAGADIALEGAVQMTQAAIQIAKVQTVTVEHAKPTKEIYLSGKVEADERNIAEITARFGGRIEKLFVNFTGQEVKRGQALASVYSPELVTAQKELFEAARFRQSNPSFYEAAVNKLKLWDLSDQQIQRILESKKVRYNFNVLAPQSGTVVVRNVSDGDYVKEGQSLFEVVNLNQVWVVFDAYQSDLPWIQVGDTISFAVQSLPGQTFTSEVTFIDPVVNAERRVAEVRTEVQNNQTQSGETQSGQTWNRLKPEMFAQGVLESALPGVDEALVLPKSAVLWTGKRAVVYVKQPAVATAGAEALAFAYREVVLGPEAGAYYVVNEGLEVGEEIVVNGVFKVDAAAQLQGKVSMMNPEGGPVSTGHDHGEIVMKNEVSVENSAAPVISQNVPSEFQQQLAAVMDPYLFLKNALVAAEAEAAATAAEQIRQTLADVNMSLVEGEAHQHMGRIPDRNARECRCHCQGRDAGNPTRSLCPAKSDAVPQPPTVRRD